MHPRTMRHLAIGFAGACLLLLACAKNDDTTFPNPPNPTETPPTHPVLDAGSIVFSDADGEGIEGVGGAGTYTPDAAAVVDVDVAPDAATPDLGGIGSICDVFAQNCATGQACYPNPTTGNGICDNPLNRGDLPLTSNCDPTIQNCARLLFCGTGICTNLCHPNNAAFNECSAGTICTALKQFNNVGYCSN